MQPEMKFIVLRNNKSFQGTKSKMEKILNAPPNHQKIRVNLIFAVKYNGRHKARLVADGSLTPEPAENIYSGVVSLKHLRLGKFLGELYNLELWGADIGNAYLGAHTQEKLFIIGGAEFEELQGDGPLIHHLGADYTRDKDNTLVCQPKKYIERLPESYHSMFKQKPPKNMRTPLDKNDQIQDRGTR